MSDNLSIKQIHSISPHRNELTELLIEVVQDGASIGFLPPLSVADAEHYWDHVVNPDAVLFVAAINQRVVGSVQLHLCTKPNGTHRAEIAKLMTRPSFRRNGIGRLLMQAAEERGKQENRSLLVLDTREGDPSNRLYTSLGYEQAGRIPCYAQSADGSLDATVIYYKII
ncbi:GNAT family N-acetyltransferase [Paenibacillus sp. H1-7]|uniref:GNAT family N-acetyltransferase n=1 Tax=Paenibacillus sp. H1-7 TaxID=2282849 RepID=UPI001EF88F57|nr:GNAT family N-acetyltransferase [Paenibacillus sp. H1-7]ULL15927.1 GNAT family N-acetyltransferase [Paenibacillus sp. H1-7]